MFISKRRGVYLTFLANTVITGLEMPRKSVSASLKVICNRSGPLFWTGNSFFHLLFYFKYAKVTVIISSVDQFFDYLSHIEVVW